MHPKVVLTTSEDQKRLDFAEIASLATLHSWQLLVEQFVERQEVEMKSVHYKILDGSLDQREMDRVRGFIQGLKWAAKAPAVAAQRHREMTKGN